MHAMLQMSKIEIDVLSARPKRPSDWRPLQSLQ